ncbi:iron ABC transporter substrate-binding protein [Rhizobiales bacterium RZME27]|uniref:Iron ABC transporter substrate-binding protein n=1 Tax=Endobacterium cereale TaxID=2663029 RepID=A0A6A8AFL4_9HYPH|nr:MetQ/NlpA family ABC transporter substrate-binding protein [Endobacterium cereale]MEB2844164.1 MetQ/NlpA family ABC transporter substrate-binding protein [Endobacterium cereale]MQY48577.1 iron ABC transporter substrate-binding protein [Endobacterium cereale]
MASKISFHSAKAGRFSAFFAGLLTTLTIAVTAPAVTAQETKPLRIALATSISNQAAEIAAEEAEAEGLKVELIEFNDWNTPNRAVADREVDANLFQHVPYLQFTNANTGNDLVAIAPAFSTPFGLYSKKVKTLPELPDNAEIVFSGDAVNTARSLLLLQQAKLIELKPGVGTNATLEDVVKWIKPLKITLLDGPQIARALDDVDAAATYPTFAKLAGLDASSGLIFENDPIYAFQFVTRPDMREDKRLRRFVEIYRNSPAVKDKLRSLYGSMVSFP